MDVALGGDHALFQLHPPPLGADELTAGVPSISPDSRMGGAMPSFLASVRASSTCVAERTGPRMETPFIFLGTDHIHPLIAGELAGLRQILFIGQDGVLSKQGGQVLLGQMDMARGSFYHDFQNCFLHIIVICIWLHCTASAGKFQHKPCNCPNRETLRLFCGILKKPPLVWKRESCLFHPIVTKEDAPCSIPGNR